MIVCGNTVEGNSCIWSLDFLLVFKLGSNMLELRLTFLPDEAEYFLLYRVRLRWAQSFSGACVCLFDSTIQFLKGSKTSTGSGKAFLTNRSVLIDLSWCSEVFRVFEVSILSSVWCLIVLSFLRDTEITNRERLGLRTMDESERSDVTWESVRLPILLGPSGSIVIVDCNLWSVWIDSFLLSFFSTGWLISDLRKRLLVRTRGSDWVIKLVSCGSILKKKAYFE